MTTTVHRPVSSDEESATARTRTLPARPVREHRIFLAATAAVMLHIADDNFFQPADGMTAGDHLVSGLVPLAVLALLASPACGSVRAPRQ
jgi:hypothetical protein